MHLLASVSTFTTIDRRVPFGRSFPEAVTDVLESRASRNLSIQSSNLSADIRKSTMSETSQIVFLYFSPYNTCYFLTVRAMCVVPLLYSRCWPINGSREFIL